jgi:hypothetical protein
MTNLLRRITRCYTFVDALQYRKMLDREWIDPDINESFTDRGL